MNRRLRTDKGAALLEFALILPLLVMLLLGVVDFAYLFAQNLDVRHGAREGARLVAVNYQPNPANSGASQTTDIVNEVMARMDASALTTVTLEACGTGTVGDGAKADVTVQGQTLTGVLDWAIPNPITLSSHVEIKIEQPATWVDNAGAPTC